MGGLSRNDYGFLKAMYAAGAKGYFDAAAVHPYTNKVDPTTCWNDSGHHDQVDRRVLWHRVGTRRHGQQR